MQQLKREREAMVADFEQHNRRSILVKQQLLAQIVQRQTNQAVLSGHLGRLTLNMHQCEDELELIKKRIFRKRQVLAAYAEKRDRCRDMIKRSV